MLVGIILSIDDIHAIKAQMEVMNMVVVIMEAMMAEMDKMEMVGTEKEEEMVMVMWMRSIVLHTMPVLIHWQPKYVTPSMITVMI